MAGLLSCRHNIMSISSLDTFMNVRGGCNNDLKDVYFVRALGDGEDYSSKISQIDEQMGWNMANARLEYLRMKRLPSLASSEDVLMYSGIYDHWKKAGEIKSLKNIKDNRLLYDIISAALGEVENKYKNSKSGVSDSMARNFSSKLLYWMDIVTGECFADWDKSRSIKIVAENVVKEQEYLFFYFLTLTGCDVLLLEIREDAHIPENLKELSQTFVVGEYGSTELPEYVKKKEKQDNGSLADANVPQKNVKVIIPEHRRKRTAGSDSASPVLSQRTIIKTAQQEMGGQGSGQEKSFEELAQKASSIVMIAVHDNGGNVMGTGSGIMIGTEGYILTNCHVISGGSFFSVRIEDDEEIYSTDEVIKYNTNLDMAVIRIRKKLNPLPIYRGGRKLVRGQRVVAIGSPLGLFNSVSDGIISGFRNIRNVDMIQFTAPTSPGSSGGAVLNMQGEVIGISTAGMDNGQNINLAMGYESILMFAKGFYK